MAIKLFFFDMEGTLCDATHTTYKSGEVSKSLWSRLYEELGPKAMAADAALYMDYVQGKFSYLEWCDRSIKALQAHGLTKKLFETVLANLQLKPGVAQTLSEIHSRGIRTAIISGGFMEQARRIQHELRITHSHAAADLYWTREGLLDHWNCLPSDEKGKVDFVELLGGEYGFTKEECAFVGDGKNDVHIAKHVGLSFAYNAHPELQKVATHTITDFREILKFL